MQNPLYTRNIMKKIWEPLLWVKTLLGIILVFWELLLFLGLKENAYKHYNIFWSCS